MRAIEFNSDKLHNPSEEIIDPNIFLHLLEKVTNPAHPAYPNPQKVSHSFYSARSLIISNGTVLVNQHYLDQVSNVKCRYQLI